MNELKIVEIILSCFRNSIQDKRLTGLTKLALFHMYMQGVVC